GPMPGGAGVESSGGGALLVGSTRRSRRSYEPPLRVGGGCDPALPTARRADEAHDYVLFVDRATSWLRHCSMRRTYIVVRVVAITTLDRFLTCQSVVSSDQWKTPAGASTPASSCPGASALMGTIDGSAVPTRHLRARHGHQSRAEPDWSPWRALTRQPWDQLLAEARFLL